MLQSNFKFVALKEIPSKGVALGDTNIKEGEIVSVGEECTNDLKKGDKVLFDTFKGIKFNIKGQDIYFVNYETIFCTL
jgi:co-chaperonin GroES (HSP10)